MGAFKQSVIWKLVLPVPVILAATLAAIWLFIPNMIADNVRNDAVRSAEETANQFKTLRGYYTRNVVKKAVTNKALKPSFNHKTEPGSIPLPATLIHDLSALLEKRDTSVKLYSPFPFPNRDDRKLDGFQQDAWKAINAKPGASYVRQGTDAQGRRIVRVGIADRMVAQGCVDCHNKRADTPKNDWKLNDVRGVLEISTVIEPQLAAGAVVSNRILTGGTAVTIALFVILVALMFRGIATPLRVLSGSMNQLADGNKTLDVPMTHRSDEIGEMARTLNVFRDKMTENERLQVEQSEAEKRALEEERRGAEAKRSVEAKTEEERRAMEAKAEADRKEALHDIAATFEKSVMSVVGSLSSAATEMQSSAETMSATADQTNQQATAVAAASEEATVNVQTVASSAEELSASVEEISRQVTQSNEIAQAAVDEAKQTNEKVEGLAEAAQKIGDVVSLINDIASQTNLLALNATIEAARAGDAGKGFAVVASEVKSLATQTGKATEEIGAQITAIQSATGEAVDAIQGIGSTISQLGDIAASVATAVDQQGSATREIASSVQQAAAGTQKVSGNIAQVTQAAGESQASSGQMLQATNELARQGEVLRTEVDKFLQEVRAA
jgi:methyl-accepting chemotaxis protein